MLRLPLLLRLISKRAVMSVLSALPTALALLLGFDIRFTCLAILWPFYIRETILDLDLGPFNIELAGVECPM